MTDIIHEVHEDNSNGALIIIIVVIVLAIAGFVVWQYLPEKQAEQAEPGATINLILPAADESR